MESTLSKQRLGEPRNCYYLHNYFAQVQLISIIHDRSDVDLHVCYYLSAKTTATLYRSDVDLCFFYIRPATKDIVTESK